MGAGKGGNFGNTKGNALDTISNLLAAASLIPGIDTFTDLASIPVDLLRKDWLSAGFDLLGVVPFIGEIGDTAKLAKIADNAIDVTKVARSAKGTRLLNQASNTKLKNTIKEMYRQGAKVGDGGLGDAIRHEIKTGKLVGGKSHIQKGKERLKNLENILNKQDLNSTDKKITKDLIYDLKKALEGK